MIEYYGYVTVEDERIIVLRKVLGYAVDPHTEVSEIFILRGKEYMFIHADYVDLVLEYNTMPYFGLSLRG